MNHVRGEVGLPVAIIGAGPSGLAVAAELRRRGVRATIFERGSDIGASWRVHYDHLRLHTVKSLSKLPGVRIPRRYDRWVARDDMVRYLEYYAACHDLDIRLATPVNGLDRAEQGTGAGRWVLRTGEGTVDADTVVIATGRNHTPHLPGWPGLASYPGEIVHSAHYRNPHGYKGCSVLIVGAGNSGAEIAVALAQHGTARVWWSVRTPPNIVPSSADRWQRAGIVVHKLPTRMADFLSTLFERLSVPDLTELGLPRAPVGLYTRAKHDEVSPLYDRGVLAAVRDRQVQPVAAVTAVDGPEVVLSDGTRLVPNYIIAATGYRSGLEHLVQRLPVLDSRGLPTVRGANTSAAAPNLYFVGFTNHPSGHLRYLGVEARSAARAISRHRPRASVHTVLMPGPASHQPATATGPSDEVTRR